MEKIYTRRNFLRCALLSSGTFFVALSPLKSIASLTSNSNNSLNSITNAAQLNAQAKLLFYKKQYDEATTIYKQIITAFPARITYYDGYAQVLGAQQKALETVELYREGLIKNPANVNFMHRLSLQMRNLCTGNKKAEIAFVAKHGQSDLFQASTQLMLDAIKENIKKNKNKKNKGLYFDLRDALKTIEKQNKALTRLKLPLIDLPQSMKTEIATLTAEYEQQWALSRNKHTSTMKGDADANINKIDKKSRRELYDDTEKKQRQQALKKIRKQQRKNALLENIDKKNTNKVEKYGMLILTDQVSDTDTIGRLRKYYRKTKAHDRLITLNRYLYLNNENVPNTLTYAHTLIKHDSAALTEAESLLNKVTDYVNTLPPVSIACYYEAMADLKIKNGNRQEARTLLLDALSKFDGNGGISFSLLNKYANTYGGENVSKGENVLKAMCGKTYTPTEDPIWKYVQNFIVYRANNEKTTNIMEQIKLHTALSKIQKKAGSADYTSTLTILTDLKSKVPRN